MKQIIAIILAVLCLAACEKPYERVFKQHLYKSATEAQEFLDSAEEGDGEGQYKPGSKSVVQADINEGLELYWDKSATQEAVDNCYKKLNEDLAVFKKSINPVLSTLRQLIEKAEQVLVEAESQEGVSEENKTNLSAYLGEVKPGIIATGLTQEQVSTWETELSTLIGNVEAQFVGAVSISIINPSFEPQGASDQVITDFSLVPGWNNQGYVNGVNPWDGLHTNSLISKDHWIITGRALDGDYALYVQTYSMSVWQTLTETVRENSTYKIEFNATRDEWKDAEKTVVRIQLLSFNAGEGNFDDITVLAEKEYNNLNKTAFEKCELTYDTSKNAAHIGKTITVAFRCYYEKQVDNSSDLAWKDVGAAVDNLSIIREKN